MKDSLHIGRVSMALTLALAAVSVFGSGASDLTIIDKPINITTSTVLTGVANRYEGKNGAIRENLTLDGKSYVRILGGTSSAPDTLALGPINLNAPNLNPVVTIKNGSGFYATYRNSKNFLDESNTDAKPSYLTVNVGENGGAGKFVVQTRGATFGSNISELGLWLENLSVSANATSGGDCIDVLQIDADGWVDVCHFFNENDKPMRILFNGGFLRNNYVNANNKPQFQPAAGKTIVCEGINGNIIDIKKAYYSSTLNGGMGTLRFQGDCHVRFDDSGSVLPGPSGANRLPFLLDGKNGPIEWKQTGNLVIYKNGFLQCGGDDLLPYTTDTGVIWLQNNAILDLDGHSEKVRSLISFSSTACVTNAVANNKARSVTSTLVFGAGDTDGVFAAKCCDHVNVEKIGTGTLVVSNVTMEGVLTINSGTVKFVGKNTFAQPVVIKGGVIIPAEVEKSTDAIKTIRAANLPAISGSSAITYAKTDATDMLAYAGPQLTGMDLTVAAGSLRFTGASADRWWRLVMLQTANVETNFCKSATGMEISAFSLFPSNIVTATYKGSKNHLNYGLVTNSSGTAWTSYADMSAGTCMSGLGETYRWDPTPSGRHWFGADALCTSSDADVYASSGVSETSPRHIIYRLADAKPAVSSYSICMTQWSRGSAPKKWRVESSADGVNWTVRDAHEAQWKDTSGMTPAEARIASEIPNFAFATSGLYNNCVPYRFTQGASAAETLLGAKVRVAAGATLDTDYLPDANLSFAALTVDCAAGGGTITKFVPTADGALYLENIAMQDVCKGYVIPVKLKTVVDEATLLKWPVYVGGERLEGFRLVRRNGLLLLTCDGTMIIFR